MNVIEDVAFPTAYFKALLTSVVLRLFVLLSKGIQHGDDCGVEHRHSFLCVHGVAGAGL